MEAGREQVWPELQREMALNKSALLQSSAQGGCEKLTGGEIFCDTNFLTSRYVFSYPGKAQDEIL